MSKKSAKRFLTEAEMLVQEDAWFQDPPAGLDPAILVTEPDGAIPAFEDVQTIRRRLNKAGRSAICLSGGGIRSSSFAVGVMQELAQRGLLSTFDYLSTVSGGGFSGSWLTSRLYAPENTADKPQSADDIMMDCRSSNDIRENSRYLAMNGSAAWDLAAVFVRNLAVNWLALAPFILALLSFISAAPVLVLTVILATLTLFLVATGLADLVRPGFFSKGSTFLSARWNMSWALKWLVLLAIGFGLGSSLVEAGSRAAVGIAFGVFGLGGLAGLIPVTLQALSLLRPADRRPARWLVPSALLFHLTSLAASGWVVRKLAPWLTTKVRWFDRLQRSDLFWFANPSGSWPGLTEDGPALVLLGLLFLAVGIVFSLFDPNRSSLHGIYQQRIGTAFVAGGPSASMAGSKEVVGRLEAAIKRARGDTASGSDDPARIRRLFHVINTTVNVPGGTGAIQRERRGHSFIFTPMHCGFAAGAGRTTDGMPGRADVDGYRRRTHKLPMSTALAISGAAVSPQMGTFGSALLAYPLALINVRLGYWLHWTSRSSGSLRARYKLMARLNEAFPMLPRTFGHLYLTDGGHFDNLGLYEMIRRRCRFILVIDGGRDPKRQFAALANAIRRVRTDFNVRIAIGGMDARSALYRGTIFYREADAAEENGTVIYIRPETGFREPADVASYGLAHEDFPHESTADQSFSESQFESYRNLGRFVVADALQKYANWKGTTAIDPHSARTLVHVLSETATQAQRGIKTPDLAGGIIYRRRWSDDRGGGSPGDVLEVLMVDAIDKLSAVLPKGHVEFGETLQQAASREIEEEAEMSFDIRPTCPVIMDSFSRNGRTVSVAYFILGEDEQTHAGATESLERRRRHWIEVPDPQSTEPTASGPEVTGPDVTDLTASIALPAACKVSASNASETLMVKTAAGVNVPAEVMTLLSRNIQSIRQSASSGQGRPVG